MTRLSYVEYFLNGIINREDGPAREWVNGSKEWFLNGKFHRTDGPAGEFANGDKEWFLNGSVHRTDGPAVDCANGTEQWWINDKKVSKEEVDRHRYSLFLKVLVLNRRSYKYF
jgi:hypothetical protein